MKTNYYERFYALLISVFFLLTAALSAQTDITFHVNDLLAGPADANWMFEIDDAPNALTHDGSFYTPGADPQYSNYAYRNFTEGGSTSSVCTEENTATFLNTNGITLRLHSFALKAFRHTNTVDANADWAIWGQAGDERIYADGIGEVYLDGVLKLTVVNCRLSVTTPYPTAAQYNAILGIPDLITHDVGAGTAVIGSGWGVIDAAHSDAGLVAELDPNGTGQLKYELSTISAVIQDLYGLFDFDIKIKPTSFQEILGFNIVAPPGAMLEGIEATTVDIPGSDVSFNFTAATNGDGNMNTVLANQIKTAPGGVKPNGIDIIANQLYWQLGTTLKTFTVDVTFDISEIPGITSPTDLRILKRNNSAATWAIWDAITLVDPTHIRADGLTSFSEFAIASVGNNALPVELIGFTAETSGDEVILNWQTATEVNNYGFSVERTSVCSSEWETIGFIVGHGNSNSPKEYSFIDASTPPGKGSVSYRLKQIDNDGKFTYSEVAEVTFNMQPSTFELFQNYPNPFNPNSVISWQLPVSGYVSLKVYDILGNEVATLVNDELEAGYYNITLNANQPQLASGVYVYQLRAGSFVQTKKMILLQ